MHHHDGRAFTQALISERSAIGGGGKFGHGILLPQNGKPVYKCGMRTWLFIAGINGALAVIAGAFAAHGLQERLEPRLLAAFTTGAHYHLIHAVALGVVAFLLGKEAGQGAARPRALWAARLFLAGMVLFSGSLYGLALTGSRVFAFVTPIGGVAFIAGWILLALAALKLEKA
jgi:uncharacterized membrane protein YgdD (TMEM256/DUF423 family)